MDIHKLQQLIDPVLNAPYGPRIRIADEAGKSIELTTPYLTHPEYGSHYTALNMSINRSIGSKIQLNTHYVPPAHSQQISNNSKAIPGVKNIIAVGSGKGGVGKSTVASLLALASKQLGAKVGLLDADIYGPNQLRLMGAPANTRLQVTDNNHFTPMVLNGIPTVSFAGISDDTTPVVWRGPMISSAVQQLLMHTNWPELDLLVIDLPPGTGDIQLTLTREVKIATFVLVTTPQALAVSEAGKTIAMMSKFSIPIAGYVENMGRFICDNCQQEHRLFGHSVDEYIPPAIHMLGSLPIDPHLQNAKGELIFSVDSMVGLEAIQIAESVSLILAKLTGEQGNSIIARELT